MSVTRFVLFQRIMHQLIILFEWECVFLFPIYDWNCTIRQSPSCTCPHLPHPCTKRFPREGAVDNSDKHRWPSWWWCETIGACDILKFEFQRSKRHKNCDTKIACRLFLGIECWNWLNRASWDSLWFIQSIWRHRNIFCKLTNFWQVGKNNLPIFGKWAKITCHFWAGIPRNLAHADRKSVV